MLVLSIVGICLLTAICSWFFCMIAKSLFSQFRSGEYKPGTHRNDAADNSRLELPLLGGPAFITALILAGITAGFLFHFSHQQWNILLLALAATAAYTIVGFIDDWHKVYRLDGISERQKGVAVFLISIAITLLYYWIIPADRVPYPPYSEIPGLGIVFRHVPGAWLAFLMIMMGMMGSTATLSVDFSDGLDGLAGGLVGTTALAFAAVVSGLVHPDIPSGIVMEILALLCAATLAGFLPWNWPSNWNARAGGKRNATLYMGDSGALGLGGILAIIALFSHQETLLLLAGAVFVLEGLSALISAKVLARFFFRRYLSILRFTQSKVFIPHTEFPLPFLATPLHHHFDLLGIKRKKLVYAAWFLGGVFAILGVLVGNSPFVWERYLWRVTGLILFWIVWSSGLWTRQYFLGLHKEENETKKKLVLYYGFPYRIFHLRLYRYVETIEADEEALQTTVERNVLWQRMNIFDARALLGIFCYRAGYYAAALAQWHHIPVRNRLLRPDILPLVEELEARLGTDSKPTQPLQLGEVLQQVADINGYIGKHPTPFSPVDHDALEDALSQQAETLPETTFEDIETTPRKEQPPYNIIIQTADRV